MKRAQDVGYQPSNIAVLGTFEGECADANITNKNGLDITCEVWKPVSGYEDFYEVSQSGRVRSLDRVILCSNGKTQFVRGRVLIPSTDTEGYQVVTLCRSGLQKMVGVHRLVASAFIPNPDNKPVVNHIDGDKANNEVTNLEWVTVQENNRHAYDNGLNKLVPIAIRAQNTETGEILEFDSINQFVQYSGLSSAGQCLENKTTCGDYILEYQDPELNLRRNRINSTKQPVGGNTPMPVKCIETGKIYSSVRNCGKNLGISDETIRRALRQSNGFVRKHNLHFKFVEEERNVIA